MSNVTKPWDSSLSAKVNFILFTNNDVTVDVTSEEGETVTYSLPEGDIVRTLPKTKELVVNPKRQLKTNQWGHFDEGEWDVFEQIEKKQAVTHEEQKEKYEQLQKLSYNARSFLERNWDYGKRCFKESKEDYYKREKEYKDQIDAHNLETEAYNESVKEEIREAEEANAIINQFNDSVARLTRVLEPVTSPTNFVLFEGVKYGISPFKNMNQNRSMAAHFESKCDGEVCSSNSCGMWCGRKFKRKDTWCELCGASDSYEKVKPKKYKWGY